MRLMATLLILGGLYMGYRSYEEHARNAEIQAEIDALEREADRIRRENETLAQKIAYFSSPDFQEQEAKKKLGMRRQEERVVGLREVAVLPEAGSSQASEADAGPVVSDDEPNFKKWWKLFFD